VQPGTRMPALLAHLAPDERRAAALALTHFLLDDERPQPEEATEDDRALGRTLFHSIGCVACHGPLEATVFDATKDEEDGDADWDEDLEPPDADPVAADVAGGSSSAQGVPGPRATAPTEADRSRPNVSLMHVDRKYDAAGLAAFLFEPLRVRPAGRMPDMGLDRAEARALAVYLTSMTRVDDAGAPVSHFRRDERLAARGRELFEALRCAACHELAGTTPPSADVSCNLEAGERGCIAEATAADHRGPVYTLDDRTRAAVCAPAPTAFNAEAEITREMVAFRCDACHVRGERSGVDPALSAYFRTTQPDLGEEARIPPPLTHVGAKLQPDWLRRVMFDGARVRPYMATRMPSFGEENLEGLVDELLRADGEVLPPYEMPVPEGDAAGAARDAGRTLLGTTGLGCVMCHDFNGTPSPGFRGLDLITTPERLQPAWLARFLVAPQTLRPGIVMPESWPGGVAAHQGILGGDTDAQVRAIWYYLTHGRTAHDPPGIRPAPSHLTVDGGVRVYRGRSRIAGFRGFAVGSAEGLHYAFDSELGALTALWRGEFVSVRWDGQGAGDFDPRAQPATLQRDLGVLRLESADSRWPTRAPRTKEAPRDRDPLLTARHGYRFRGYSIGADGVPTFRYSSGEVLIEERSGVVRRADREALRRTFVFDAPVATTLDLRLLGAGATKVSDREVALARVTMVLPEGARLLPREDAVLRVDLPQGRSSTSVEYCLD
jgi:mono/diheme cytochrome c family protein